MASMPQTGASFLQKTTVMNRPRGRRPILLPQDAVHKRHQLHTPCGMLMVMPRCAQQLGQIFTVYGRILFFHISLLS